MAETDERANSRHNLKAGSKSNDSISGRTLSDLGISRDQSSL